MLEAILQFLRDNTSQISAAGNITITILMFALGSIVLYHLTRTKMTRSLFLLSLGLCIEAYGWALQRLYWAFWWYFDLFKDVDPAMKVAFDWSNDNAWIAMIPMLMVIAGLILIITPIFLKAAGAVRTKPYLVAAAAVFSLYWFIWWEIGRIKHQAEIAFKEKQKQTIELKLPDGTQNGKKMILDADQNLLIRKQDGKLKIAPIPD